MKKAQVRANLLDDSSPFVNAPKKGPSKYPQNQMSNQGYPPAQRMQYVSHPLQQQYPVDNYNGSGYPQQRPAPQPQPQPYRQSQHQNYQPSYPNPNPNPNYNYDYERQQRPFNHSHASYPATSSNSSGGYPIQSGGYDQQQYVNQQGGSYNGPYQSNQMQQQHEYSNYEYPNQPQQIPPSAPPVQPVQPVQQQPAKQPRSHSHSYNQLITNPSNQPRSKSQPIITPEVVIQKQPLRPKQQVFSLEDESDDENIDYRRVSDNSTNSNFYDNTTTKTRSVSPAKSNNSLNRNDVDTNNNDPPRTSFNSSVQSKNSIEQDKIQLLEEKIQRLERVLALQELESKTSTSELPSKDTSQENINHKPVLTNAPTSASSLQTTKAISVPSQVSDGSAPPLPPPPPPEKKSLLNSPKANLFLSEMEKNKNSGYDELRLSASSLIPTDKSISDHSDGEADHSYDFNDEEPPPSYEELEKSGTLTYSKSIYRTGFEKAGYQMDHVVTPTGTGHPLSSDEITTRNKSSSKRANELMFKRKIPSQIDEETDKNLFKSSLNSIPTLKTEETQTESKPSKVQAPYKTSIQKPVEAPVLSQIPPPTAAATAAATVKRSSPPPPPLPPAPQIPNKPNKFSTVQSDFKPPKLENSQSAINQRQARSTMDSSLYTPKVSTSEIPEIASVIKYSTDLSYEELPNGVIKPILPSKAKDSTEESIARFRKTREKALSDYKRFTPKIQFYWAILLVETLSKSEVLSKMTIDGKLRKNPISYKKLKKQRLMFLTTAVKVLEKIIQIAPNDTRARLYLGDIYSGGIHPGLIERDEKLGYQLFYDAATKQNDPVACYRIACCLESGVGCPQDIAKSIIFFERGATLGDPSSMCQLGMMHFAGVNGCVQDISLSIAYHKQAYETLRSKTIMGSDPLISSRSFQDARGALYTLAKLHQTDRQILCLTDNNDDKTRKTIEELKISNVWCNSSKALKYYLEAGKLGHNESQACLGYYYSQGFFPTHSFKSDKEANNGIPGTLDARKSIYWFSKAAADGHTYAALGLARWYGSGAIDGDGKVILKRDEQQAFLWGRKAADAGELVEAEFMIGICFEQGFGVEKNAVMAANYFERSARKGYKKAINKMKAIRSGR